MEIVGLDPLYNTLPSYLQSNTMYIMTSGDYIITYPVASDSYIVGSVFDGNCISLIGEGNVTIYSTGQIDMMLRSKNKQYNRIQNIRLDGTNNG